MQIICPHCTTSYAVDPAKFGAAGRKVRCARCHETWQAHPEEIAALAPMAAEPAYASGAAPATMGQNPATNDFREKDTPHIESPSISAGWGDTADGTLAPEDGSSIVEHSSLDQDAAAEQAPRKSKRWVRGFGKRGMPVSRLTRARSARPAMTLNTACAAMGALVLALVFWRADVVRLMPQTATLFKSVGLGVNLRGLSFDGLKITTETVDNKPVLVIEGSIIDVARKPVELPRLRFMVRDEHGSEIYAWNAILEQPVLNPGEKAWFKSRLASPPPEGREIAVRFFNRRDIAAGEM